MDTVYDDFYTVTEQLNTELMICTPWQGGANRETLLHHLFLSAYDIGLNDSFHCKADEDGGILLETIQKMTDDFNKIGSL